MNIFFLSRSTAEAAKAHHDQHVIKMVIESAQLLSTAWHQLNPEYIKREPNGNTFLLGGKRIFAPSHTNHPMAIWVRENTANYQYCWNLGLDLADEYYHRWGQFHDEPRRHNTQAILETLGNMPPALQEAEVMTNPPLCMPDEYKRDDPVEAYRAYYNGAKLIGNPNYTNRERPEWATR